MLRNVEFIKCIFLNCLSPLLFITAICVIFKLKQIIQIEYNIRIPTGGSGMEWMETREDRGVAFGIDGVRSLHLP